MQTLAISDECVHLRKHLRLYAPCLLCILIIMPFESLFFFARGALFPALNETSVSRIIKRNFLIIKESMSHLSLAFAILFLFQFFCHSHRENIRRDVRMCDLRGKKKTVIHVALRYQRRRKIWERLSLFYFVVSADGMGLKWSWWQSLLRLASSQSCQGNRPPDVAGDLGARRRHAEWRCPVNNHWLSHFKLCR